MIGYVASGIIGLALGMIGGGGSILTMPVLVYLFHIEPTLAAAYSLFIVGTTALVGAVQRATSHLVDFRTAAVFAIPSIAAVYVTRTQVIPRLPHTLCMLGAWPLTRNMAIMLLFAILMVGAAWTMMKPRHDRADNQPANTYQLGWIMLDGLLTGILSGLVGAGGGFLIIPALVLFARLPLGKAMGTSLLIIAVSSLTGFYGDWRAGQPINFGFLAVLSTVAIAGLFVGNYFAMRLHEHRLRRVFGVFVLLMGTIVIFKEIFLL